ncbi:MAG: AAA family ATPase [Calditrichaeota bacterium]|nr:AAA family ATPase [Calditrichota bacterium]MCB0305008.1 AAA family ATPase [Calditrichota bacterium]
MHIKKILLRNFRGAQSLSLDLHERLNVLAGVNGAGKSSILDATAILLSWVVSRIKSAGTSGRPIMESDITNGKSFATLDLNFTFSDQDYNWKLVKTRKGHASSDKRSILNELNGLTNSLQNQITAHNENVNLPLFTYYPVNRAVLDIPLRIRAKHRFDLLATYDGSLSGGANFRTFFEWFREREDLENELRRDQQSLFSEVADNQFPDPQLEAVRSALLQFMPEFSNLTVRRNPLRMEVDKNGKRLTVNQLSDGEKCLMAMVGDLARRLAIANPARSNSLDGQGIILIDELDLHLHPKWQRMVVPRLLEVFPHCQFILTTHSPHIITHIQPYNLFLLKLRDTGVSAEHPSESYGKNVDRVLEDLMELETTRPDFVEEALREIYEKIDRGELDRARISIHNLQEKIGDDPDLVKAGVLIKRKELIGK